MKLVNDTQLSLWGETPFSENPEYLTEQLITYIGNKRALLGTINQAVQTVMRRLGKSKLRCCDVFSGSGVVSRLLKAYSSLLISNDFEDYTSIISKCYLANRSDVDAIALPKIIRDLNNRVLSEQFPLGFIEELYSPKDEENITLNDRVFYTIMNARRIDNYRRLIDEYDETQRHFLLAPLLSEASIHANTAGVFKGFYKNKHTKIGQYGGSGSDALFRIKGAITLRVPILSRYECDYEVWQEDANQFVRLAPEVDLAYIDPPYNQHPYGSNYFMLNLITKYCRPTSISPVSGIPIDWKRSGYNVKAKVHELFADLVANVNAHFLLVSFNDEGFITPNEMTELLQKLGHLDIIEIQYNEVAPLL